jgi:hypothetical protein
VHTSIAPILMVSGSAVLAMPFHLYQECVAPCRASSTQQPSRLCVESRLVTIRLLVVEVYCAWRRQRNGLEFVVSRAEATILPLAWSDARYLDHMPPTTPWWFWGSSCDLGIVIPLPIADRLIWLVARFKFSTFALAKRGRGFDLPSSLTDSA